jgi:hypothetical protein
MPAWPIAGVQHIENRRRGENFDHTSAWPRYAFLVTRCRPAQQRVAAHGKGGAVAHDKSALRQAVDAAAMAALDASIQSFAMQHVVHFRSARPPAQIFRSAPMFGKCLGILATALKAWPMTSGERGRLIEKEQLGIEPAPDVAMTPSELGDTADPLPRRPAARRERLRVGVKSPAAITHEQAASRCAEQFAKRIDPILQRHGQSRLHGHGAGTARAHKPWTVVTSTALLRLVNPDACVIDIDKEREFVPF